MGTVKISKNIYEEIIEMQKKSEEGVLVTVVDTEGSTPREPGAKMIVKKDGTIINTIGGGAVELLVIRKSFEVMKTRRPVLVYYDLKEEAENQPAGMVCGGKMGFFIEPLLNPLTLYVFGAGHIGRSIYKLALFLGFNIVMIDDRKEFANREEFPEALEVYCGNYNEIVSKIKFIYEPYIVIATKSHFTDEIILKNILKSGIKYKYLGLVASKIKWKEIKESLSKEFSEEIINTVHAPVGIPIKSKSPEEIAISIMGEIIKIKNESKT